MAEDMTAGNLHVPQAKNSSALNSVKSIMDAYRTQSKIPLYDESSAQSQGAGNENIGVTGRNIPLSMLRPSANPVEEVDENGNRVIRRGRPTKGQTAQEVEAYGDIAKAYKAMKGIEEDGDEGEDEYGYDNANMPMQRDLSSIRRFQANYVEEMPDTDEGLLEILALAIDNARANLEMLESLYAALSPSSSSSSSSSSFSNGFDSEG